MNIFENRVQSFHTNQRKWPYKGRLSAETLARSGFYFTPGPSRPDSVTCFLCDARLDRWRNDVDPIERHGRMAPDCPWVILSFPYIQHALPTPENAKSTRLSSARVRTFKKNTQWPPKSMARKQLPTAKKLAESGFYYAPTKDNVDQIACAYCLATVTGMDRTMDLLAKHAPSCIFSTNKNTDTNQGPITRQQLRQSKANSPEKEQSQMEQIFGSSKKAASIDDSIWDIGKAYAQKDRVVLTYSKKTHRQQQHLSTMLPKHLTEGIPRPASRSPSPVSPELERFDSFQQKRKHELEPLPSNKLPKRSLDKGKGRVVPQQQPTSAPSPSSNRPSSSSASTTATLPKQNEPQASTPISNDLFDDPDLESLAISPIRPVGNFQHPGLFQHGITQSTPKNQLSRMKQNSIMTPERLDMSEEDDPRKRLKPFSPPSSPTRRSMNASYDSNFTSPSRSSFYNQSLWIPGEDSGGDDDDDEEEEEEEKLEESQMDHDTTVTEGPVELLEEQLNMTVEEYINSVINSEIENVENKSNEFIQQIQSAVDRIRQKVMETTTTTTLS